MQSVCPNNNSVWQEPTSVLNPHKLYTNYLKNLEFGKEAPQNFCLERATIADRQGASEDKDFEGKPTWPKTDFSGSLCIGD